MISPRVILLALLSALIFPLLFGGTAISSAQGQEVQGFFGTITNLSGDHPRAVAGEIDITLDTGSGVVELTATPGTFVRIPGLESATVDGLNPGDSVAVLSSGGEATNILVRTTLPGRTRHFTGVVIAIDDEGSVTLQGTGEVRITALALDSSVGLQPGELVTAVIEQDLPTAGLVITGLDRAADSLVRITSALRLAEKAGAASNLEALRQRLISNSTHHLTGLLEASETADRSSRTSIRQQLESVTEVYAEALSQSNSGKPRAQVTGIISSIDPLQGRVIIQPDGLAEVEVGVTSETRLWRAPAGLPAGTAENWLKSDTGTQFYVREFGGRETSLEQLDIASRVRVWYELETNSSTRILVLPGESLKRRTADAILAVSQRGEAVGVVTAVNLNVNPQIVSIDDQVSGRVLRLAVSPDSSIRNGDLSVEIDSLQGALVSADFDPDSFSIIELSTFVQNQSEGTASGVVHGFISKIVPSNFVILTPEGKLQTFTHTDDTVIRRDGRPATISQVRLGDLVRPSTRFSTANDDDGDVRGSGQVLVSLSLKSPKSVPVNGTIRGIGEAGDGEALVTISTNWLELVSMLVTEDSVLTRQGNPLELDDLQVGQRVVTGSYDPITTNAARLVLGPPRTLPVKGEISSVDETQTAITITTRRGNPVRLFVPDSHPTVIKMRGITDPQFSDLQPGQQVRIAFYDPESMEALKVVIN